MISDIMFSDLWTIDGLYVGQLTKNELIMFDEAIDAGKARRNYEGTAGFLGLAKVKVIRVQGYQIEQEALDS